MVFDVGRRKKPATLRDELIQYCNDILSGKITACTKHQWSCQRLLGDFEREVGVGPTAKQFPYVFDEDRANRYLDWMRLFPHTKGPLAGKQIEPHIVQKFIFGQIYGWVHRETGMRRFRKAYWQVGRKNAKSQSMAIMGLCEMSAMEESCAEVYVAATKRDQTRYVWGEADLIHNRVPGFAGKIVTKYDAAIGTKVILHPKSGSFFSRMSKDDKKKGDGANPQCGIIDEYHAHETTEYPDVLSSGMKTRRQPLLFLITTAGFELNHPCYTDEYAYVSKLLDPNVEIYNDRYFALVCELDCDEEGNLVDDIKDEKNWIKANPIIAETKEGLESIRAELKEALDKPEKLRDFLTKTMDVWVNMRSAGYMNMGKWKACGATKENPMPDVTGMGVYVGNDLSAVIDLTSSTFEVPLPDGRFAVFSHSFIPESTLFEKMKTDKVPYMAWVKAGWLSITPGNTVDYRFMVKYMKEFVASKGLVVKELCFDRYLAAMLMQELSNEGYVVAAIPQGIPTLGLPTKDFRAQAYDGKVIHDNNPVLSWAMSNAVVRKDHNDNIMLDKERAVQRIDPAAALINAHVRAMVKEDNSSPYDERGVRAI